MPGGRAGSAVARPAASRAAASWHARWRAPSSNVYRARSAHFGNLLFCWDVLFGTAKITRPIRRRSAWADDLLHGKERWFVEMFCPLVQSRRSRSTLSPSGRRHAAEDGSAAAAAIRADGS